MDTSLLLTTDSQRTPKGQQSVQNNLQKRMETKTASINHKNTIKFLTFVIQIVSPLLCFVDFCPCRACLIAGDLLIQLLVGHTPLTSSRLGVWPVSQPPTGTSEIGMTSLQRTRFLPPVCPLFRGFTVSQ